LEARLQQMAVPSHVANAEGEEFLCHLRRDLQIRGRIVRRSGGCERRGPAPQQKFATCKREPSEGEFSHPWIMALGELPTFARPTGISVEGCLAARVVQLVRLELAGRLAFVDLELVARLVDAIRREQHEVG